MRQLCVVFLLLATAAAVHAVHVSVNPYSPPVIFRPPSLNLNPLPPRDPAYYLTTDSLMQCMPKLPIDKAKLYVPFLNLALKEGNLTTCCRRTMFLAQLAHVSDDLTNFEEASGAAYEGRVDLGNTEPGDGERFKGRGPIPVVGRMNYYTVGRGIGTPIVDNPTLAADPSVAFRTAVWFWKLRPPILDIFADLCTPEAFESVTERFNGGTNGLADSKERWERIKKVLNCPSR